MAKDIAEKDIIENSIIADFFQIIYDEPSEHITEIYLVAWSKKIKVGEVIRELVQAGTIVTMKNARLYYRPTLIWEGKKYNYNSCKTKARAVSFILMRAMERLFGANEIRMQILNYIHGSKVDI